MTTAKTWDVLSKRCGEVRTGGWATPDPLAYGLYADEVAYCRRTGEVVYWDNGEPVWYTPEDNKDGD